MGQEPCPGWSHVWAHSNAIGVSPAHTKCLGSSNALRSRECLICEQINLVHSRPNTQQRGRKTSQLLIIPGSSQPRQGTGFYSGFYSIHEKWNNCSQVSTLIAEDAAIALRSAEALWLTPCTNKARAWLQRLNGEKVKPLFFKVFIHTVAIWSTSILPFFHLFFPLGPVSSLDQRGFPPLPSIPSRSLTLLPHKQLDMTSVSHPEEQPRFMNWSLPLPLLPVDSQAHHPETLQVVSWGPWEAVSERALWALQPHG